MTRAPWTLLLLPLFLLALFPGRAGAQSDHSADTTVTLFDPGTGDVVSIPVTAASYGNETLEIRTASIQQAVNYDRVRLEVRDSELGPGALVRLVDSATGQVLAQSGLVLSGVGTSELVISIGQTPRVAFRVEASVEAYLPNAPVPTTTAPPTTVVSTTAAPTSAPATTAAPTTTTATSLPEKPETTTSAVRATPDDAPGTTAAAVPPGSGPGAPSTTLEGGSGSSSETDSIWRTRRIDVVPVAVTVMLAIVVGAVLLERIRSARDAGAASPHRAELVTADASGNASAGAAAEADRASVDAEPVLVPPPLPRD